MLPSSRNSSKIWNKVTEELKPDLICTKKHFIPIHFPFAKTSFEAVGLGEVTGKAGFKCGNSKVEVRRIDESSLYLFRRSTSTLNNLRLTWQIVIKMLMNGKQLLSFYANEWWVLSSSQALSLLA